MTVVVALTGASGMPYAVRVLEILSGVEPLDLRVIVTENGEKILLHETGKTLDDLEGMGAVVHDNGDLAADIASGSFSFHAMVIVPASMNTTAKIAVGMEDNLVTRTAAVALKERRRLVLVPRETPVSTIHLEAMARLSAEGVVILPASPGFYHRPGDIGGLVDHIAARILDHLGLGERGIDLPDIVERWKGMGSSR
ncbi:MAG: UbiX family flavin prenyltransferase [Thermoplasmata archaeon]|nr:UbiX family flavin prenyltransferase [Thermoplasmata archaeon]